MIMAIEASIGVITGSSSHPHQVHYISCSLYKRVNNERFIKVRTNKVSIIVV